MFLEINERMSRHFLVRYAALLLLAGGVSGCRDELPTATGPDRFPEGTLLTSLVVDLPAAEFLEYLGQFTGYTGVRQAEYGLVANQFDGVLQARTLSRLGAFPDTISYTAGGATVTDTVWEWAAGSVVATVDTVATQVTGSVTLRLHAAAQEWDPGSATWALAIDTAGARVPWAQPGGSLGAELGRATWAPRDTVLGDTIRWAIDSLAVAQMAADGFHGLVVVAEGAPSRVQIGPLLLRTGIRPASRPDTVLAQTIAGGPRTFVFSPAPPDAGATPGARWMAGGIGSARSLFRVTLPERVRACPPGTPPGAACPERLLRDMILNEVALLLEPDTVGGGFRLLAPTVIRLRTLAEPELGRRAPLGAPALGGQTAAGFIFAEGRVTRELFAAPTDTTLAILMTDHFRNLIARDTLQAPASTAFALLAEPEGANFGYARFVPTPRLRIVYTLPVQRTSP
jgi:hypothetical protein